MSENQTRSYRIGSLNTVLFIGRMTRDPELRLTPGGRQTTTLMLAGNRRYRHNGEWKGEATFLPVVLWNDRAERACQFLRKGTPVLVEGRLQSRRYERNGQTHYAVEVLAARVQNLEVQANGNSDIPEAEVGPGEETS